MQGVQVVLVSALMVFSGQGAQASPDRPWPTGQVVGGVGGGGVGSGVGVGGVDGGGVGAGGAATHPVWAVLGTCWAPQVVQVALTPPALAVLPVQPMHTVPLRPKPGAQPHAFLSFIANWVLGQGAQSAPLPPRL